MKKLVIAGALLIIVSCNNTQTESGKELINIVKDTAVTQKTVDTFKTDSISLDEGKKWKVKNEMMVFIRKMESDVNKFEESVNTKALNDYLALSKSLLHGIDELTSNCTMEGRAHDELHKWLVPYIDLVNEFNESKTTDQASMYFQKIKKSFETFNVYFD